MTERMIEFKVRGPGPAGTVTLRLSAINGVAQYEEHPDRYYILTNYNTGWEVYVEDFNKVGLALRGLRPPVSIAGEPA